MTVCIQIQIRLPSLTLYLLDSAMSLKTFGSRLLAHDGNLQQARPSHGHSSYQQKLYITSLIFRPETQRFVLSSNFQSYGCELSRKEALGTRS